MLRNLRIAGLLMLGAALAGPSRAGGVEPCQYASVFPNAALNVMVLPYRFESASGAPLARELFEGSRQIASLVHLEVLMGLLKYGSIGAKNLLAEAGQLCDVEQVLARVGRPGGPGALKPGQALLLLWGRVFEQGGEFYLQSYLRFVRQGSSGPENERLFVKAGAGADAFELQAGLPAQALGFAPRRISRAELVRIDRDFRQAMLLRQQPRADSPGRSIDFKPHEAFAFWIGEARGDWMQLRPMAGGPSGWVRVRGPDEALAPWSLQRWLPELGFVDAVAGFMRLRAGGVGAAERARALRAIEAGLLRYERAVPAELAPPAWGLAAALRGWLDWERGDWHKAAERFDSAALLMPDYAAAHQLAAVARAGAPGAAGFDAAASQQLGRGLLRALALAPEALQRPIRANLDGLYRLYERRSDWSPYSAEQLALRRAIVQEQAPGAAAPR